MEDSKINKVVYQLVKTNIRLTANYIDLLTTLREDIFHVTHKSSPLIKKNDEYIMSSLKGLKEVCEELRIEKRNISEYLDRIITNSGLQDNEYYLCEVDTEIHPKLRRLAKFLIKDTWLHADIGYKVELKNKKAQFLIPTEAEERMMVMGYSYISNLMSIINQKDPELKQAYCVESIITLFIIINNLTTDIGKEW